MALPERSSFLALMSGSDYHRISGWCRRRLPSVPELRESITLNLNLNSYPSIDRAVLEEASG